MAKYSTKTASGDAATTTTQHRRLQATIADLDLCAQVAALGNGRSPYALLGNWGRMLGFRGHFATKSRLYSITLGSASPRTATRPGPHRRQPRYGGFFKDGSNQAVDRLDALMQGLQSAGPVAKLRRD